MFSKSLKAALGATLIATTAAAQDSADGVYFSGFAQSEYYQAASKMSGYYASGTFGYAPGASSSFPLGFEVKVRQMGNTSPAADLREAYSVLFLNTGFGRLNVGAAESAAANILPENAFTDASLYGISTFTIRQTSSYFQVLGGITGAGASLVGTASNLDYALSLHSYPGITITDIGLRRDLGGIAISGAAQYVQFAAVSTAVYFQIGAEGQAGGFDFGATYGYTALFGIADAYADAYVGRQVTPRLYVKASAAGSASAALGTLYGLSATFNVLENGYVRAAVYGGSSAANRVFVGLGIRTSDLVHR